MRGRSARFVLAATLVLAMFTAGSAQAQTAEDAFDRGHAAYVEGRYEDAYGAFSEAVRYGVRDARLEFNLGNAAFKTGRLPEAVLHYARAARWDPSDVDAQRNLRLTQSFLLDRVEPADASRAMESFARRLDRIGPDRWLGAAVACVWGLLALVAAAGSGWARFRAWMGWTATALVVIGALALIAWGATLQRLDGRDEAVVMAPAVEVLAGPGRPNATLFTVHEGLLVERRSRRGEWVQIRLPDGLGGWVLESDLEPL